MTWAPDYVTTAELKSYVRIGDAVDDAELALAISAASRAIDDHCNRQFGAVAVPEERVYRATPDYDRGRWVVAIDDLQTVVGLVVTIDGAVSTDFVLGPRNAVGKGLAWTRLVFGSDVSLDDVEVTIQAPWGWTATPNTVKLATRLQASRFSARRDSPYGIAGSPAIGSELRLLSKVDPDVAVSLKLYRRMRRVG